MFIVSYQNTERGISLRNSGKIAAAQAFRLREQRAAYEAELAEQERLDQLRAEANERALAYASEMRRAGKVYRASISDIERRACRLFNVTRGELHSARRAKPIVFARQFVMYWTVRLTPLSLPQIGRRMGDRDHTTVLHGKRSYPEKRALMGRYLRPTR